MIFLHGLENPDALTAELRRHRMCVPKSPTLKQPQTESILTGNRDLFMPVMSLGKRAAGMGGTVMLLNGRGHRLGFAFLGRRIFAHIRQLGLGYSPIFDFADEMRFVTRYDEYGVFPFLGKGRLPVSSISEELGIDLPNPHDF